jgi:hypothetical protein
VREREVFETLPIANSKRKSEAIVTVELVLQVERDEQNRLNGSVRVGSESRVHPFSGTLELMRVFEELVPADPARDTTDAISYPEQ